MRIIVVDDDLAIRHAVQMLFENKGYTITTYSSGEPLLQEHFQYPDLFILDTQLPGPDGLDVCRYLKSGERTKHIPILILSASPQVGALAKAACADAFLEKPFKMKELRAVVARLTGNT
jgi:DNA-binding response OmpR family regulator